MKSKLDAPFVIEAGTVRLRAVEPADEPFLYTLYASTRLDELAPLGWSAEQQDYFLRSQFAAQHQHYQSHFPATGHTIILLNEQAVGRVWIARKVEEVRGVDIALLPAYRNSGIGTAIINELMAEAEATRRPFRISVEKFNRKALRLYQRLGFQLTGEIPTHYQMEWTATPRRDKS